MNRRTLTINSQPRRPSAPRPTCGHGDPKASHRRCVLDPGHLTDHFADGCDWPNEARRTA